jgi:hypothetical protein
MPPGVEFPVLEEGVMGEPNFFELIDTFFIDEVEVMYDEICSIVPGMTEIPGDYSTRDFAVFSSFNSVTLQIGRTGRLDVTLYDVVGRQVCSLTHGIYEKGSHIFTIPKSISAGVYFIRVNFEGIERSGKVVRYR